MALENVDPTAILAYLEAKVVALQNLIASWKAAQAVGALGPAGDLPEGIGVAKAAPVELPVGLLRSMSLPEAVKTYLSAAKRKQSIKEIAEALKQDGVESTAARFETVVTSALNRLKKSGVVLRFKDGWDLAESYPEQLRNRLLQESKASLTAKKKPPKAKNPKQPIVHGLGWKIKLRLESESPKAYSSKEMAEALGMDDVAPVAMTLGRLVAEKKVAKVAGGKYQAMGAARVQEMPKAI